MVDKFFPESPRLQLTGSDKRQKENRPEYLLVKLNSEKESSKEGKERPKDKGSIKVKLTSMTDSIEEFILTDIVKKHMNSRGKTYPNAKLFSKDGVELHDDDIFMMKTGEIVYLARYGERFEYS
jgi:hypothetical protein